MFLFTTSLNNNFIIGGAPLKTNGASIRLVKNSTTLTPGQTGTYIGNDGTTYNTICIGTQEWMSEDLREELTMTNPELLRLGIGFDELARSAEMLVSNSGRFISLNRESWKEAVLQHLHMLAH